MPHKTERSEWGERKRKAVDGADIVFLDPDNGIASGKLATGSKRAMKSVFMTEIKSLHQAGHSLVIYHHATRWQKGVTVPQQAAQLAERLHQSGAQTVLPVISRRGTVRIFLVTNVNVACRAAVGHFAERWRDNIDPVQEFVADPQNSGTLTRRQLIVAFDLRYGDAANRCATASAQRGSWSCASVNRP